MNILHRGNWEPPKYKFECDRCGTVWECEGNEIQTEFVNREKYVLCRCPVCNKRIAKAIDK